MTDFEFSVPVLVVGAGASGCAAALVARDAGAEVLVIEQDARASGSTGLSQGLICAAGTRWQRALGVEDDADVFFNDIMAKTRGQTDPTIARAIADGAGPTLEWLAQAHDIPFALDTGFRAAYGATRLRVHGWPGHGGLDLIQLLHRRLAEAGVDVLLQARLAEIVVDRGGRVVGVVVERPDGSRDSIGCEALVLASGGFAANAEMVRRHMPEAAMARHNGHEGNRGDGIRLAAGLGAAVGDMGSYQGYAMLSDPQGITVPPGLLIEGGFLVNIEGRRFTDELVDIAGMVHPVMAQPKGVAWVVFDAAIEARCAYIPETIALRELNAAVEGDSLEELAHRMNVDAEALQAALDDANLATAYAAARRGGRVVTVGLPNPAERLDISALSLVADGKTLIGSYMGSSIPQRDIPRYIALWRAGRLPVETLLTSISPLSEINSLLDALADGRAIRQIVRP